MDGICRLIHGMVLPVIQHKYPDSGRQGAVVVAPRRVNLGSKAGNRTIQPGGDVAEAVPEFVLQRDACSVTPEGE